LNDNSKPVKVLQIGNYPPPMCGWGIQTLLVDQALRQRGEISAVLKINENRQVRSSDYIDVQGGADYIFKVVRYAARGYRLNAHVNGMSKKGYVLALIATVAGRLMGRTASITFHGGLSQDYFPRHDSWKLKQAFRLLFMLAGKIACDSLPIKEAIESYGIPAEKVTAIATFSNQYLSFTPAELSVEIESFLAAHDPAIFSYVSFRPEYRLDVVREGIKLLRKKYPKAGLIWLGFPEKEMAAAREFLASWPDEERAAVLLIGNLTHDQFLTLMTRCLVYLRSPACDGVAASVLEALTLKIPVVASENGRRPEGVVTYSDLDAADMCAKLEYVLEHWQEVKAQTHIPKSEDNVARMADWLTE
jgi:glycosyltransferase involved in cell wall biosynthesis